MFVEKIKFTLILLFLIFILFIIILLIKDILFYLKD